MNVVLVTHVPAAWRRAAYTNVSAGDKRSIMHQTFRGATAAIAPNRQLAEVHFTYLCHLIHFFYFANASLILFEIISAPGNPV